MGGDHSMLDRWKYELSNLRASITNLWDDFGGTTAPLLGLVVNLGLAAIGLVIYWQTSGLIAYAGGTWAILHILAIVKWVIGL